MNMPCTSLSEMAEVTDKLFDASGGRNNTTSSHVSLFQRNGPPSSARDTEVL